MMPDPLELLGGYFDDEIGDEEFAALQTWLDGDDEHAREFVLESFLHSRLRDILRQDDVRGLMFDGPDGGEPWADPQRMVRLLDEEAVADERKARAAAEQHRLEAEADEQRRRLQELAPTTRQAKAQDRDRYLRPAHYAAAAAAAVCLILFGRMLAPLPKVAAPEAPAVAIAPAEQPTAPPVAEPAIVPAPLPVIATVTASLDAAWRDASLSAAVGTPLTARRLMLESGVVEIEFGAGAKLVVEAPAEVELVTADRARLKAGRVVANVPEQAVGFTLRSQAATFVDLGTEFGVEVDEQGDASVHVLDGEVALIRGSNKETTRSTTMSVGVANRVSADGSTIQDIEFNRASFIRKVPESPYELAVRRSRPLAYWRLNEAADSPSVASSGRVGAVGVLGDGVTLAGVVEADAPGPAVAFAGDHAGIEIGDSTPFAMTREFTLETWAKPAAGGDGPRRALSNFVRNPRKGFAFGVVNGDWYQQPVQGLLLHVTLHGVYDCISTTETPAGQWVHLAATIGADGRPTLYINGVEAECRIGAIANNGVKKWNDKPRGDGDWQGTPSDGPLVLGRNHRNPQEAWRGQLSETAIYDRVLPAEEIRRHFDAATPPRDDAEAPAGQDLP